MPGLPAHRTQYAIGRAAGGRVPGPDATSTDLAPTLAPMRSARPTPNILAQKGRLEKECARLTSEVAPAQFGLPGHTLWGYL